MTNNPPGPLGRAGETLSLLGRNGGSRGNGSQGKDPGMGKGLSKPMTPGGVSGPEQSVLGPGCLPKHLCEELCVYLYVWREQGKLEARPGALAGQSRRKNGPQT